MAQRALGTRYTGKIDGLLGQSTLAAVEQHPNHDQLIALTLAQRLAFLQALKTWKTFGKGWPPREWTEAKTQFAVIFGERFVI